MDFRILKSTCLTPKKSIRFISIHIIRIYNTLITRKIV